MMAAIVPTHQLTPLMVIFSLGVLAVFCRHRVWLLMLLMIGFTVGWDLLFAWPWLSENMQGFMSSIGTPGRQRRIPGSSTSPPPATAKPWWPRSTARTVPRLWVLAIRRLRATIPSTQRTCVAAAGARSHAADPRPTTTAAR